MNNVGESFKLQVISNVLNPPFFYNLIIALLNGLNINFTIILDLHKFCMIFFNNRAVC
jgi:hypothetical protein